MALGQSRARSGRLAGAEWVAESLRATRRTTAQMGQILQPWQAEGRGNSREGQPGRRRKNEEHDSSSALSRSRPWALSRACCTSAFSAS